MYYYIGIKDISLKTYDFFMYAICLIFMDYIMLIKIDNENNIDLSDVCVTVHQVR